MKATKEALMGAEGDLERVTQDLRLPLLADIRRQLSEIKDHVANRPRPNKANVAAPIEGDGNQHSATTAAADGAGADLLDCADEELLQKARDAIDRGMMARSAHGSTVGEVIRDELAKSRPTTSREGAAAADDPLTAAVGHDGSDLHAGSLIAHVRRVRFEGLTENGYLGQGTFGVVLAGKYFGKDVAVKKARAPIFSKQTLQDFRCGLDFVVVLYRPCASVMSAPCSSKKKRALKSRKELRGGRKGGKHETARGDNVRTEFLPRLRELRQR